MLRSAVIQASPGSTFYQRVRGTGIKAFVARDAGASRVSTGKTEIQEEMGRKAATHGRRRCGVPPTWNLHVEAEEREQVYDGDPAQEQITGVS